MKTLTVCAGWAELFSDAKYIDLAHGMTARSTRSKVPTKKRSRSSTMRSLNQFTNPNQGLTNHATT